MGEVYLARDLKLNRIVALKILPTEFAADEKRMHRFIQEAQTASALNHPNIVTVFEIDDDHQPPYIASEFMDGETLRERLSRAPLSVSETIEFAIQIASALVAAHEAGIVHRDIKPENVMIRRDGIVKVLDFGIAKVVDRPLSVVDREAPTRLGIHTQPGMIIGTATYMSPEQARPASRCAHGYLQPGRFDLRSTGGTPYVDLYVLTASGDLTPTQALAKSRAAAQRALELDDNLAEAHIAMASIDELQWNWTGAEAESKRAIELNPNISLAHNIYALLLTVVGRHDEGLAENKRAQELDPLRVALKSNQAKALLFARRYDEAIQVAQAAIKLDPTFPNAHWCLAEIYAITGNYKESVNEYQKTIDLDGPLPTHLCFLGYAYGLAGRRSDALAVLQKLKTTDKYVSPTELAVLYIGLGDKKQLCNHSSEPMPNAIRD